LGPGCSILLELVILVNAGASAILPKPWFLLLLLINNIINLTENTALVLKVFSAISQRNLSISILPLEVFINVDCSQ
jgi:hypothetical protein